MRWEYGAPITELYGRLVNLDIAPGFCGGRAGGGKRPGGSLTGQSYPDSLIRPDKRGIEPRVGLAWRPDLRIVAGGSRRIWNLRRHFGLSNDRAANGAAGAALEEFERAKQRRLSADAGERIQHLPLDHAGHFCRRSEFPRRLRAELAVIRAARSARLAAIDGNLSGHQGNARSAGISAEYFSGWGGESLSACPAGFAYLTSNGNSTREAGQVQLRRRLHNGLTATALYTLIRNPSMTIPPWEARERLPPHRIRRRARLAPDRRSRAKHRRVPAQHSYDRAELARL